MALARPLELSVVIPAYNEREAIGSVVEGWSTELARLGIDYEIRVYDDGSTDGTSDVLTAVAATQPRVVVVRQTNRGHGPTVLRGYREARGEWVFQTDGDGEGRPADFSALWTVRAPYDFIVGRRMNRRAPLARRLLTLGCWLAVRLLFSSPIHDANCPYRLMRRGPLLAMLAALPDDVFAPNAILAGLAARRGLRIAELPIGWDPRRTGTVSIFGWRTAKVGLRAFREALNVAAARRKP